MAQQKPWERYGAPPAQNTTATSQAPSVIMGPPKLPDPVDPTEAERLRLAQAAEARQAAAAARDAQKDTIALQRDQLALQKDRMPDGGKPPQESERTAAYLAGNLSVAAKQLSRLGGAGDPTAATEVAGMFGRFGNYATPEARQRAINAQLAILEPALTLATGAAYNKEQLEGMRAQLFPEIGDKPGTLADKRERLRGVLASARVKAGSAAPQIDAVMQMIFGQEAGGGEAAPQPQGSPQVATESFKFSTDEDRRYAALAQAIVDRGGGRKELDALADKYGVPRFGPELDQALSQAKGKGVTIAPAETGTKDLSGLKGAISGIAGGTIGGLATGAANGILLGGLDELTGAINSIGSDQTMQEAIAEADLKKGIIADNNAPAYLAGNIAGGLLTNLGGAAALGKAGLTAAPKVFSLPALGADVAQGAITGGLESNQDRLTGAAIGAGGGAAGGVAGRFLGKAVAPTGGVARELYDQGVRPSPGQRFGGVVNTVEEALQSVPIVGSAVRATRDRARDQFERGAFNQALGELDAGGFSNVKTALPDGMGLGTEPHKFAQAQFNRAYNEARSGMQMIPDGTFAQELGTLQQGIANGGLTEASAKRFENIVRNQVGRRMQAGQLNGESYKVAQSQISGIVRNIRNNKSGDQELADALDDFVSILDGAARRSSAPEAVAKLDAADAGYAKLVRIEEAALKRGEAGRFSPAQFDSAVQKTAGGRATRSKAFLAGDALMQKYATAGRSLMDVTPDSGTPLRAAISAALLGGGAGVLSPKILAAPALAAVPYAPGLRNLTAGALAPRASPIANKAGGVLATNRAGLAGAGSVLALDRMGF